jgi:dATP pyrophosphohydrolase
VPRILCRTIEVCIFKFVNDRPLYLLLHRAKEEKVYPGIWQLMSGAIEENEKVHDAALREFREETGMEMSAFWVAPFVNSFYEPDIDAITLSPLFVAQVEEGSVPRLSPEHSEYGWFSYEEARQKLVWPGQREGLRIAHEYLVRGEKAASLLQMKLGSTPYSNH